MVVAPRIPLIERSSSNFGRGLLCATCMVSGRILGSWLVVSRVLFRLVDMSRRVLSNHTKTAVALCGTGIGSRVKGALSGIR